MRAFSRHQLALYCGGSGDHNPIHVDIDFAKKFGFKDVFAHGMLSMAFLGRLATSWVPQKQIRALGTRFTSITWVGDVITVSGKVVGKRDRRQRRREPRRRQSHLRRRRQPA
ncbi:MaoC/PaaZ C-terminal domain-containing protein [Vineibacter terrae]|uniref:MaoC/PaaZ C-terminal domain-containing protein n=1 Tax=Vineibacter terrae TaxID=2586908 RepID=UPI001E59CEBC|nr:MaoC/PaaZ C-terminal domain-containing protein [Vineibacter terrae]